MDPCVGMQRLAFAEDAFEEMEPSPKKTSFWKYSPISDFCKSKEVYAINFGLAAVRINHVLTIVSSRKITGNTRTRDYHTTLQKNLRRPLVSTKVITLRR